MAFCRNCGAPIDENAKFCAKCGAGQIIQAVQQPAPQPVYQQATVRVIFFVHLKSTSSGE